MHARSDHILRESITEGELSCQVGTIFKGSLDSALWHPQACACLGVPMARSVRVRARFCWVRSGVILTVYALLLSLCAGTHMDMPTKPMRRVGVAWTRVESV